MDHRHAVACALRTPLFAAVLAAALTPVGHADPPDSITLVGTIRDFPGYHPDFDVIPSGGWGHYAGNVELDIGDDRKPVLKRAVAPGEGDGAIVLVLAPTIGNGPTLDTYDPTAGPYGGANVGPAPSIVTGATMPTASEPSGLPFVTEFRHDSGGTVTLPVDFHCETFEILNGTTLRISGHRTILVDERVTIADASAIELDADSSLRLFSRLDAEIRDGSVVNGETQDPSLVTITTLGTTQWTIRDGADVHATVVSPAARLVIRDTGELYGRYTGRALTVDGGGAHVDAARSAHFGGAIGRKVTAQWYDATPVEIAPHLYEEPVATGGNGDPVWLTDAPEFVSDGHGDTWDSTAGPYGPSNRGPAPTYDTGATMPVLVDPPGMPATVGHRSYDAGGGTISADLHCDDFSIGSGGTVTIDGAVRILVDGDFALGSGSNLELAPGATLELHTKGQLRVGSASDLNRNTGDPSRVTILRWGAADVDIAEQSHVYARIEAPNARLDLTSEGYFYGTFWGRTVRSASESWFHSDTGFDDGGPTDACGVAVVDAAGSWGSSDSGGISSKASFDEWFTDVAGLNQSAVHPITLTRDASGVYLFRADDFHPIDDALLGNEGETHNYLFTYELEAEFVYEACAGQFIQVEANDDGWVFVDGRLAIDLGGMRPGQTQMIRLDRFGLTDGDLYHFKLFFANRQSTKSSLRLQTNVELSQAGIIPTVSAQFD